MEVCSSHLQLEYCNSHFIILLGHVVMPFCEPPIILGHVGTVGAWNYGPLEN